MRSTHMFKNPVSMGRALDLGLIYVRPIPGLMYLRIFWIIDDYSTVLLRLQLLLRLYIMRLNI